MLNEGLRQHLNILKPTQDALHRPNHRPNHCKCLWVGMVYYGIIRYILVYDGILWYVMKILVLCLT